MARIDRRHVATIVVAVVAFAAGFVVGSVRREETERTIASVAPEEASRPTRVESERPTATPRRRVGTPSPAVEEVSEPNARSSHPAVTIVRIVVRDRYGAPLAKSRVLVSGRGRSRTWDVEPATESLYAAPETAADGSTSWSADFEAFDRRCYVGAQHPGHVSGETEVDRETAVRDGVEVVLERAITVRGRCVDQNCVAVAGVQVLGPRQSGAASSDAAGRFELRGLAESAGYVRLLPDCKRFAAKRVTPTSAHDGVVDLGDVILANGGTVRGRFVDVQGEPVAGAGAVLVCRDLESGLVGRATTDAEGRFAFEHVGDGTHDICMTRPDFPLEEGSPSAWAFGVPVGGDEIVVRVPGDRYAHVRWLDEDGAPAGFFGGRITWFALDDASERIDYSGLGSGWRFFHIPVRLGATYEVLMELDGFEPLTMRIVGTDEKDRHVDAVLRRKAR